MPPKKQPTVWLAEPHTIAKISILRKYLYLWFLIVGRRFNGKDIWFVDGFSGPGKYTNFSQGSPLAAIASANAAIKDMKTFWKAGKVHLVFIEEDLERFRFLNEQVEGVAKDEKIEIHFYNNTFEAGLKCVQSDFPAPFSTHIPFFVFIDPFGAKGAPFSLVSDILKSQTSEILINLDVNGIGRVFAAGDSAGFEVLLNRIFGDEDWKSVLVRSEPFEVTCRKILALYKENLRKIPGVKYIFSFEMRTTSTGSNYFLLFASRHSKGLAKMKESMRRLDQDGSYRFVDAHVGQSILFRFDSPNEYADRLLLEFDGKEVSYESINDWALNESPFENPKQMLAVIEGRGELAVISKDPKRRKKTYNEENLISLQFNRRSVHG